MDSKITEIRQSYDNGTLRDGVVVVMEKESETVEYPISGTEWSVRCTEHNFDVSGMLLTSDQIQKINHLLNHNADKRKL